jgi:NTP pyrophosphatase (non-canonical NTP hydrolase)
MNEDSSTGRLSQIGDRLRRFVADRDWSQFHDPKNLAMAIASEAGELLSEMRWISSDRADEFVRDPANRDRIEREVGDVAIALLLFCDRAGIELLDAIDRKIALNAENYPAEQAKGRSERPVVVREPQRSDRMEVAPRLSREVSNLRLPAFHRYIGVDYSGAETPTSSLKVLRVYMADRLTPPVEIDPPPSGRKYWTRRGIGEWLAARRREDQPTIVGIDHGFSFPLRYFETHNLPPEWPAFLDDFQRHWPTDDDNTYVDFVRDGICGNGANRSGNSRWRRLTELRAGAAKSVFHFDVQGSVAKSTHAGLPWLRYLRGELGARVHFWPFDGWDVPAGRSAIVEVYPSLWSKAFTNEGRTPDQHDAYAVAARMRLSDLDGSLAEFLHPTLSAPERTIASIEGWILGVP